MAISEAISPEAEPRQMPPNVVANSLGSDIVGIAAWYDRLVSFYTQYRPDTTMEHLGLLARLAVDADSHGSGEELLNTLRDAESNFMVDSVEQARQQLHEAGQGGLQGIDQELSRQEPGLPSALLEWKQNAEQATGHPLSWGQWLAAAPEAHGPSNAQLFGLMSWSLEHMKQQSANPEFIKRAEEDRERYIRRMRTAVRDRGLHPVLLHKLEAVKRSEVFVGSLLDRLLLSEASGYMYPHPDRPHVVLPYHYQESTFIHEMTHVAVGFGNPLLKEGVVELCTQRLLQGEPNLESESKGIYAPEQRAIHALLKVSGMTEYDLSRIASGEDYAENERHLADIVRQRTGYDVVGYLTARYRMAQKQWPENSERAAAFTAAELEWITHLVSHQKDRLTFSRAKGDLVDSYREWNGKSGNDFSASAEAAILRFVENGELPADQAA
jgi:hypothetical protein